MRRPAFRIMRCVPLLVLGCCVSGAPVDPGPGASPTGAVQASATANIFSPQTLTVAQGGTVTWSFGTRTHNVTFVQIAGAPASVPNTANNQAERQFDTPGTYAYACTLHAGMIGTVVVK
jgi:plastocyanin